MELVFSKSNKIAILKAKFARAQWLIVLATFAEHLGLVWFPAPPKRDS